MNTTEVKEKLKAALEHISKDLAEGRTLTVKVIGSAVAVTVDPPVVIRDAARKEE